MNRIRCIVVEDQSPARRLIEGYIARTPELELAGSFAAAGDARAALSSDNIDAVILDLNLPGEFGFDLLRGLSPRPRVVVITAHPQYAVEGFALDVDDYLLKPVAYSRFLEAVNRLTTALQNEGAQRDDRVVTARRNGEVILLRLAEIQRIEAVRDHTRVVTDHGELMFAKPLHRWLGELPAEQFVQTHKSHIVNLGCVRRITFNALRTARGDVPIGRAFRPALTAQLKAWQASG